MTSSSRSSADGSISAVVPDGNLRASLVAIRDRLAAETDDVKWAKHRKECTCLCGMADIRALVALTKRLEETMQAIEALPAPNKEVSAVDRVRARSAARRDELAAKRAQRQSAAPAS